MYVWAKLDHGPLLTLQALGRSLSEGAAFSGCTAGWLHGLELDPCHPVEATFPYPSNVATRAGLRVHHGDLWGEIMTSRGLPTTRPLRTVFDIARHTSLTEAVVAVDMALHASLVDLLEFRAYVDARAGAYRIARARRVAELAMVGAESPMETRLRLLLVLSGLPCPELNVPLHDRSGGFLGRPDLYYAAQKLGIEYDSGPHREQLVADDRRQNRLLSAGVRLLRFTSPDVYETPARTVALVRGELTASRRQIALRVQGVDATP
jgi:hypothetical protein